MVRHLAGLLVVSGCFSPSPPAGTPCPNGVCPTGLVCSPASMTCETTAVDASIDSPDATPDGCYGRGLLTVCPDVSITGQSQLNVNAPTTLNTTTSSLCVPYHLPTGTTDATYCVIAVKSITIGFSGRLTATGSRPLVLLATNQINIGGILDVASHIRGNAGPDADPIACSSSSVSSGAEGGPGGSFGSKGGDGGAIGAAPAVPAGAAIPSPVRLRGGCPGRTGAGANGGALGRGGGAVYLISDTIAITGTINASGAGGIGGGPSSGGGGGGSGGMIGLDAPVIEVAMSGRIFANGGGGGEGGGGLNVGDDGVDSTAPMTIGAGGAGGTAGGGNGGDGAGNGVAAQAGENDTDSGGGGGGGAGVIRVFPSRMLAGSISPPPT